MYRGHLGRPDSCQPICFEREYVGSVLDFMHEIMRRFDSEPITRDEHEQEHINAQGNNVCVLRPTPLPPAQLQIVSHIKKAHIHLCCSGQEIIETWPSLDLLHPLGDYDAAKDIMRYQEQSQYPYKSSTLRLLPGNFVIFFKNQAYRAGIQDKMYSGKNTRTIVVKLPMDAFVPQQRQAARR